jgi:acetyltransferase
VNRSPDVPTQTLPAGYPAELQRTWLAADGTAVRLRALHPGDLDREIAFAASLSSETLMLRVQYSAKGLSREDAARLLQLDYVDSLAIGAFVDGPGGESLVGVSRYARESGSDRAECAIVVADAWQGRGLGTELMRTLGQAARARGILWLEGSSLAINQRIHDWARRFGFSVRTEPHSGGEVRVVVDLAALPA